MVVSLLPCGDARNECNNSPQQVKIEQAAGHSHQNDHNDACSPFCSCTCCNIIAGFTLQPLKTIDLEPCLRGTLQYPIRNTFYISAYSRSIWQPPKINA
ncbi:hypothetical protein LWM68_09955 [Niabella sp. W65]|nr:hypothetical protein [Niabella sp. W65]MCH7363063.1 hypothetical protein [Niabella sp. W65]ULT38994.1 hypothetical protein KRR40_28635 [Niabella sp. I65]